MTYTTPTWNRQRMGMSMDEADALLARCIARQIADHVSEKAVEEVLDMWAAECYEKGSIKVRDIRAAQVWLGESPATDRRLRKIINLVTKGRAL